MKTSASDEANSMSKTMVLTGCRVLSSDLPTLFAGEEYLGVTAGGEQEALAAAIAPEATRARWWAPGGNE